MRVAAAGDGQQSRRSWSVRPLCRVSQSVILAGGSLHAIFSTRTGTKMPYRDFLLLCLLLKTVVSEVSEVSTSRPCSRKEAAKDSEIILLTLQV